MIILALNITYSTVNWTTRERFLPDIVMVISMRNSMKQCSRQHDKAVEQIKTNTRQYAKRQMTWFRKDAGMKWYSPEDIDSIVDELAVS